MLLASQKLPLHLKKKIIPSLCLWARGEREFPFPGNTSIKFSFPSHWKIPFPFTSRNPGMQFLISHPVPGKRNFQPGIRTGNATILYSLVLHTSYMWNLPMVSMTTSTILFSESKKWNNLKQVRTKLLRERQVQSSNGVGGLTNHGGTSIQQWDPLFISFLLIFINIDPISERRIWHV